MEASTTPQVPAVQSEDARLESLGYEPQLNRVLGFFANFSVAFTYLSPMVGIYSLFVFGAGAGGPRYIWLMPIVVGGMYLVARVFGPIMLGWFATLGVLGIANIAHHPEILGAVNPAHFVAPPETRKSA